MTHLGRDNAHEQSALERMLKLQKAEDPREALRQLAEAPPAPSPADAPAAPPRGLIPSISEVGRQALGGVRGAVVSSLDAFVDLQRSLAAWAKERGAQTTIVGATEGFGGYEVPIDAVIHAPKIAQIVPDVADPETLGGQIVRSGSQFLVGFLPMLRVAKLAGLGPIVAGASAGAVTDFFAFDPDSPRVSNLINDLAPSLRNPVTEYLATPTGGEEDENRLHGRFKNAIEGLGIGALGDAIFSGVRVIRNAHRAKSAAAASGRPGARVTVRDIEPLTDADKAIAAERARSVQEVSESYQAKVQAQKRGTRSAEVVAEEVQSVFPGGKMSLDDVRAMHPGTTLNDTEAVALIGTMADEAQKLRVKAHSFLAGQTPFDDLLEQTKTFADIDPIRLGAEAETGRTLRLLGEDASLDIRARRAYIEQFGDLLRKAGTMNPDQFARMIAESRSLQEIAEKIELAARPTFWDLLQEVRVNGILSGPKSALANAFSNTGALVQSITERGFAGQVSRVTGGQIAPGEGTAMILGVMESFGDALKAMSMSFRGQLPHLLDDAVKLEGRFGREAVFARFMRDKFGDLGRWVDYVEGAINAPGKALLATDDFFKAIAFGAEKRALARREAYSQAQALGLEGANFTAKVRELESSLLSRPPDALADEARRFASYVTFTNQVREGAGLAKAISENPIGRVVVPFTRTPLNIFRFSLERTPLGALIPSIRRELTAGGAAGEIARAKMAFGSMLMGFFGSLAWAGVVTGRGPSDPEQRAVLRQTGWQPYSVKIGGEYLQLSRIEPLGSILGLAADYVEIGRHLSDEEREETALALVAGALWRNLSSKTFLQGVADFSAMVSFPEREGGKLQRFAESFVPFSALARQIGTAVDPHLNQVRGLLGEVQKRIDENPPERDMFGEKITLAPGLGSSIIGPLLGAFVPISVSKVKDDPVSAELSRIHYAAPRIPTKIGGHDLTPKQIDRLAEVSGKGEIDGLTLKENLQRLFGSDRYKNAGTLESKRVLVSDVVEQYREQARGVVLKENQDVRAGVESKRRQRAGVPPISIGR